MALTARRGERACGWALAPLVMVFAFYVCAAPSGRAAGSIRTRLRHISSLPHSRSQGSERKASKTQRQEAQRAERRAGFPGFHHR